MKRWERTGSVFTALLLLLVLAVMSAVAGGERAQAAQGETVTITLKARRGSVPKKKVKVDADGVYGKLPAAVRKGYDFRGWYTAKSGGTRIHAGDRVAQIGARVLYAHWKLRTYTIRYHIGKGALPEGKTNPESYTVKTTSFRLASPVREGYVFTGWFTSKSDSKKTGTGIRVKKIRKGSEGDLELYARYEPITYTIRFRKNGVLKQTVKKIRISYGKKVILPEPEEKAFASWNTSPDGSGTQYAGGMKVKNLCQSNGGVITLYANPFIVGNNIQKLYDYFQRIGFTKEASAAIVGNLMYESGGGYTDVKLNAVEWSTGRGIGMCQWTNTADMSRRTNFERFCASRGKPWPNQDLKVQVDFLMAELEGVTYGKVWYFLPAQGYPASYEMSMSQFRKLKNVGTAVAVFCANFERPRPEHANLAQRTNYAVYVMNHF